MDERCYKHPFEAAEELCQNCGWEFCNECLVYAFGPKEPPLCLACALAKSGVRSNAARPPVRSKRAMRKHKKEMKRRQKSEPKTETVEVGAAAKIDLSIPGESSSAFEWADSRDEGGDSNLVAF